MEIDRLTERVRKLSPRVVVSAAMFLGLAAAVGTTVLAPIPLCANPPNITTVPLTLTPFKAVAPGKATVTASVKPQDSSSFETFILTVTVVP